MSEAKGPEHFLSLGTAFFGSKALLSAVELGVFTALAEGPQPLEALRTQLGLHPRSARDFFDALVALGVLDRQDGVYRNTPEADRFFDRNKPSYEGGWLEMHNARTYGFWNRLTDALKSGKPQNESRQLGIDTVAFFDALYSDPVRMTGFLTGMTGASRNANQRIARQFPWSDYQTFADVGTAQGDLPLQVALAQPHLTGIGFDLAQVRPVFDAYVKPTAAAGRLRFVAGSFFTDELPRADVITMGHILHDWDLQTKKMLIKKAYDALPDGGALLIYEHLIDDERRANALGLLMSLNMLIESDGGFDFSGADCRAWLTEAGFRDCRVEQLIGVESMIVAFK